jgi:hypothetical protein
MRKALVGSCGKRQVSPSGPHRGTAEQELTDIKRSHHQLVCGYRP